METTKSNAVTNRPARRSQTVPEEEPKATNTMVSTELKIENLDLGLIQPDPNQPRKSYDELKLLGLADSIKEFGVLQPITVRKSDKGYTIVMGERRYRSSKIAGKRTIPAIVRKYENNDVLELQIIENLQRQDVEPTEEAEAIAFLSEKYTPSEIAQRLGRGENFVRQRIKLSGLIEGFKHFVRNGEMTISLGVAVALFEPEDQKMMLEIMGKEFNGNQLKRMVDNKTYDLSKAPFKVEDKDLIANAGSCIQCPFNAINQGNLFGDGKMICTKSACYETKKLKVLLNLIKRAKKENRILIPDIRRHFAGQEGNQLIISQMEKEGLTVYLLDDIDLLKRPSKPTTKSIKEDYYWKEFTKEELKKQLDGAIKVYNTELEAFNTAEENGYIKGFYFDTDSYKTEKVFVKIEKEEDNESPECSVPLEKRKMEDCTPEEQITKLNSKEVRKKEIENNKQFEEVATMIRETDYIHSKKALTIDEMVAFTITLYENTIGYYERQQHFKDFYGKSLITSRENLVKRFKKNFKKETFNKLIRFVLTKQVHFGEANHTNNFTNISFYTAMQGFHGTEIAKIEKAYAETRSKREKRLEARIAELQKQVKALKA
ncbi:ParB/RepB/Spo0J family partition protein [Seonamhaeicola aphaedonensis]|uniref:ParB family chromosome partitioning protein n=1 Tax=Seonamhaeicola aphaedonensis TaxID=1461338 RepID=A0A3D9H5D2_9FLAO|nr:ParB/RepB/Spo0J family partition protein [Seonamhaeicola aphaedonensis]RED44707.1 ParB family chromosome partitioning protein [Seonamhaeicola aphaedonensis]